MTEAKTQAVQALVAGLIGVAVVTAGVGIFEVQEHHSAVGWFTSCAVCIIAAILIPLVIFVLFPWIEHLGTKEIRDLRTTHHNQDAEPPLTRIVTFEDEATHPNVDTAPLAPTPPEEDRTPINATPSFLTESYRKYDTSVEAEAAMGRYLGKWMQVNGVLYNMSFLGSDKNALYVRMDKKDGHPPVFNSLTGSLEMDGPLIALVFKNQKWIDRLIAFNRGDEITAIGKIESIDFMSVGLTDCELMSQP